MLVFESFPGHLKHMGAFASTRYVDGYSVGLILSAWWGSSYQVSSGSSVSVKDFLGSIVYVPFRLGRSSYCHYFW